MDEDQDFSKILIVTPYYGGHGGGVELVAQRLAVALATKGWQITWVASGDSDSFEGDLGWTQRPVHANNAFERRTGVPFPLWGIHALRVLWAEMKPTNVVMVHESLYLSSMMAVLMARLLRKPVLLVQHISTVPYKSRLLRMIVLLGNLLWTRMVHALSDTKVYISAQVMEYFEGPRETPRSILIPNGVDLDSFFIDLKNCQKSGDKEPRILFVGRFVEKKGLDIIEGLAQLRPDLVFAMAGGGPIQPQLWGLQNVEVLGYLAAEDLRQQYRMADALLLPSHGEGFPLVVQEAIAMGLAPLVSDEVACALPGVREHVYQATVDRSRKDLAEVWSALIDEALIREVGGEARSARAAFALEHWSWTRCLDSYDFLLRKLNKV